MPRVKPFKFEGGKELERALKDLAAETGKSTRGKAAVRRAGTKSLEPFVERWKALVPVLSGALRESIHTGTRLTRRQARLARRSRAAVEVHAGTADPAGQMTEFGNAHQAAQPSGRPAWDQTQKKVLSLFGKRMWEEIRKTAERLARKSAKKR